MFLPCAAHPQIRSPPAHPLPPWQQHGLPQPARTKRSEVMVACPNDDALVEILSRVPAKPRFPFKCVFKPWCHLITDSLGCRKFPQTLQGFLFGGSDDENYGRFIDLLGRSSPLVDASFSFLTKTDPNGGCIWMCRSYFAHLFIRFLSAYAHARSFGLSNQPSKMHILQSALLCPDVEPETGII
ncbi:hypothetical protein BAE44_0019781 [Dichanthelium oligosanthes]|uniref:F-box domain-containing protein n=1 Tax=Dichanthelium oligosanthes TaxID=888268 RepID=A0A1E5V224_9POAL|nr:hypothetical protein BAE44_0019781 [Dichanthelium oligosanthes]